MNQIVVGAPVPASAATVMGGPSTPQRFTNSPVIARPQMPAGTVVVGGVVPPGIQMNPGSVIQQQLRTPQMLVAQQPQQQAQMVGMQVDASRKRLQPQPPLAVSAGPSQQQQQQMQLDLLNKTQNRSISRKKGKLKDKILPQKVRDMVPESQYYMDLLAFERKLDATIMRKRLDIQEAIKRPMKLRKKLRVFITNHFHPVKADANENDEDLVPQWELKIEGRLLDDNKNETVNPRLKARKFSSFFKSLVIELDKDLYGPDNHLVEWHRTASTAETDGFQVKRHGDQSLKCTILMLLDYQPPQFKLDQRLAKLLAIHTATRPVIIQALWMYIKMHKLQDAHEKEFINLDKYLQQIFECDRIRFSDIPSKLHMHCLPPDPIVINHYINIEGPDYKKTSIYDIDVEIDDTLRDQMKFFLTSSQSMLEVAQLDQKINEQIEQINQMRLSREFYMSFSDDPQDFINKWLVSQSSDLKLMLDLNGNPEEERLASFYHEPWIDEAVSRYFYNKVQQKRAEVEQVLGIRNN